MKGASRMSFGIWIGLACACTGGEPMPVTGASGATGDGSTTAQTEGTTSVPTASATSSATSATSTTSTTSTTGAEVDCDHQCAETWVYDGDLTLTPDVDMGDFECMREVTGWLEIQSYPGALPRELTSVRKVGRLSVRSTGASDLMPLQCVQRAEGVYLSGNQDLVDISALAETEVTAHIHLFDNNALVDASPLRLYPSASPAMVSVSSSPSLERLPVAAVGVRVASVELFFLPSVRGLGALSGVRIEDYGEVKIGWSGLETVAGLADVLMGATGATLELHELPLLEDLAGLDDLTGVGRLRLTELPLIEDLSPLGALEAADVVTLAGLPKVSSLAGLGDALKVGTLTVGQCDEAQGADPELGMAGLTSLSGGSGIESIAHLRLMNNGNMVSLEGLSLSSLAFISCAYDELLSAEEAKTFASQYAADFCYEAESGCGCN